MHCAQIEAPYTARIHHLHRMLQRFYPIFSTSELIFTNIFVPALQAYADSDPADDKTLKPWIDEMMREPVAKLERKTGQIFGAADLKVNHKTIMPLLLSVRSSAVHWMPGLTGN